MAHLAIYNHKGHSILCADRFQLQYELHKDGPYASVHPPVRRKLWGGVQRLPISDDELMQTVGIQELLILPGSFQAWGVCPGLWGINARVPPWGGAMARQCG